MNETEATFDAGTLAEIEKLVGTINLPADVLTEIADAIQQKKLEKATKVSRRSGAFHLIEQRNPFRKGGKWGPVRRTGRLYLAEDGEWKLPEFWQCEEGIQDQLWAEANMEEFRQ